MSCCRVVCCHIAPAPDITPVGAGQGGSVRVSEYEWRRWRGRVSVRGGMLDQWEPGAQPSASQAPLSLSLRQTCSLLNSTSTIRLLQFLHGCTTIFVEGFS